MKHPTAWTLVALMLLVGGAAASWHHLNSYLSTEPGWRGLSEEELLRKLGPPEASGLVRLTHDWRPGFEDGALETYVPKTAGHVVELKELFWESRFRKTRVWLRRDETGRWVVVEALAWGPGIVF
jgi:hypothetical protein